MLETGIICYEQIQIPDTNITFTLEELKKLVSSISIVTDIKNIIQSKTETRTNYLTINSSYSSKHNTLDLIKHYADKVYVSNLIGYQELKNLEEQDTNLNLNLNLNINQNIKDNQYTKEDLNQSEIVETIIEYVDDDGSSEYIDGEEIIEIIEEIYEDCDEDCDEE